MEIKLRWGLEGDAKKKIVSVIRNNYRLITEINLPNLVFMS